MANKTSGLAGLAMMLFAVSGFLLVTQGADGILAAILLACLGGLMVIEWRNAGKRNDK
jgi:hypothetical protein